MRGPGQAPGSRSFHALPQAPHMHASTRARGRGDCDALDTITASAPSARQPGRPARFHSRGQPFRWFRQGAADREARGASGSQKHAGDRGQPWNHGTMATARLPSKICTSYVYHRAGVCCVSLALRSGSRGSLVMAYRHCVHTVRVFVFPSCGPACPLARLTARASAGHPPTCRDWVRLRRPGQFVAVSSHAGHPSARQAILARGVGALPGNHGTVGRLLPISSLAA